MVIFHKWLPITRSASLSLRKKGLDAEIGSIPVRQMTERRVMNIIFAPDTNYHG
jgi:hypothetical protein